MEEINRREEESFEQMEENDRENERGEIKRSWSHNIIYDIEHGGVLDEFRNWDNRSIYKVPYALGNLDSSEFTPRVVSFGPYHHGQGHLMRMECHKTRTLCQIFSRSSISGGPRQWLEKVKDIEKQLQDHYVQLDPAVWLEVPEKFAKQMLLDGCFMLEILRVPELRTAFRYDYSKNDPVLGYDSPLLRCLRPDMLLLENQLPLLLLEKLVALEDPLIQDPGQHIRRLFMKFFDLKEPAENYRESLHVLDMYRMSLVYDNSQLSIDSALKQQSTISVDEQGRTPVKKVMWSVEMLHNAGIRFKTSETRTLSFQDGTLNLPTVIIDGNTKRLFLNLMAFEMLHVRAAKKVTSYISLMGLITSKTDVRILSNSGIIFNALGNDPDIVQLFNFLSRNVALELDKDTQDMLTEIDKNYRGRMMKWNKRFREWRWSLQEKYFKNPCTCISLSAGAILLILTFIQTIFTVLAFYSSNDQIRKLVPARN